MPNASTAGRSGAIARAPTLKRRNRLDLDELTLEAEHADAE
jgi:hypothetical protein